MESKKVLAQKCGINYLKLYGSAALMFVVAVFVLYYAFKVRGEGITSFIVFLILSLVCVAVSVSFAVRIVRLKRIPQVMIWYEDEFIHFYDGFKCRPSDIFKTKQGASGTSVVIYTAKGKHVCRYVDNPRNVLMLFSSIRFGAVYTESDLRVLMKKRQNEKF